MHLVRESASQVYVCCNSIVMAFSLPTLCLWLASFPGSPRARTKNRKERGEPGKIYHVRNVIGRENLITCGRTNELAHAVWTNTVAIALWPTEWD